MESTQDVSKLFEEYSEGFTVYVCEQLFAVGCGYEYLKQFKGTENMISTDSAIKKSIKSILSWTQKNVPNIADLIIGCFFPEATSTTSIVDIITALSKLFAVHEHQAAGPKVIDPIIIQEGKVSPKYLAQLIALHKESILQPAIIILLKDNDFNRARQLLSHCPNGINVKLIRNSGECEMYKVVNCGAENVESFLDAYAHQCFSTCSHTPRSILENDEWSKNSILRSYGPSMFQIRSHLLYDEKDEVRNDILDLISKLECENTNSKDITLIKSFLCMTKLFHVYCNDRGGNALSDALALAKDLDNPLLLAHTYRYANLFIQDSKDTHNRLLMEAKGIFEQYGVADHAIYCENNLLFNQFYTDSINVRQFQTLQQKALNNVPGLVGMSLILNNTGVAHLYSGRPEEAIEYFQKGLDYSRERIVQKIALMTNSIIARSYCMDIIEEKEMRKVLNYVFDNLGCSKLPFLSANYVMNILSVAMSQDIDLAKALMDEYPILTVVTNALTPNQLGSGSLVMQLQYLNEHYSCFDSLGFGNMLKPQNRSIVSGKREQFVKNRGFNPTIFNAWL